LRKYHFLVLFPINPLTLARYRAAFPPSRAKDDPTDAELQLALLRTHRDKLQPLNPQNPIMRALAQLVAHRQRVVGDQVRITNRLTSTLKNYFPQALQWFQDKDTVIFCDLLRRWPTLKAAQLARRAPLETCLREHHGRSADVMTQRINASSDLPPPNLRGVGRGIDPAFLLGPRLLPAATRCGQSPPGCRARSGIQVETHSLAVLAGSHAV